jgi:hypothetical protein
VDDRAAEDDVGGEQSHGGIEVAGFESGAELSGGRHGRDCRAGGKNVRCAVMLLA